MCTPFIINKLTTRSLNSTWSEFIFILFICLNLNVALKAQEVTGSERPAYLKSKTSRVTASGTHVFKYKNPITSDTTISMRDYAIIRVGKKWYCTGTSLPVWTGPNPGVRLLVSEDMIHWSHESWLIDATKLPSDCPYNGRFWAPEIHYLKGKFWLIVNSGKVTLKDPKGMSNHSIWLFSAAKVTGPYKLVNGPLTPQYNNDATLFEDTDGQVYLYCSGNGLFQAKLDLEKGKIIGELQKFRIARDSYNPQWMWGGIEGPFVLKREGVYYMFFSTWTRGYEVGLLKSKSPLGPWELASNEPIFGTRKKAYRGSIADVAGNFEDSNDPYCETGHNSIFEGPDGKLWSSCHYIFYKGQPFPSVNEKTEPKPQMGIEPLYFRNGLFTIGMATWTEQTVKY
jgi:xylan 1,4-beta-xylosidase